MKMKLLTALFLPIASASAQSYIFWNTLPDTNGLLLTADAGIQRFQISPTCFIDVEWTTLGATSSNLPANSPADLTFQNNNLVTRRNPGAQVHEFSTVTTDTTLTATQHSGTGTALFTGSGTSTMTQVTDPPGSSSLTSGATFTSLGASTFTLRTELLEFGSAATDSWAIAIDNHVVVPEPSSSLLLGLASLGMLTRRKERRRLKVA